MTTTATLPRPAAANAAHGAPRMAANAAQRHGSTGAQTGFAQLLRGQDDDAGMASQPAASPGTNAAAPSGSEAQSPPAEREREHERQPGANAADPSAPPPQAQPQPQADAPKPDLPSTWALAGLGSAATPGAANAATDGAATGTATSDPLAALRDAMGHGLAVQRRHGPADDRKADRASNDPAADAPAGPFKQVMADARAGTAADGVADTQPQTAPAAQAAAPVADGALPSLGAITDPAHTLHTPAPAATEAVPSAHANLPASPGTPAFGPALGAQLSTWLKDGIQHASLELHPQDLGPIDVRIAVKDGQTRIDLTADVASTRQALAEAMPQLSAALGDVGLSLSGGSVADPSAQGQAGDGARADGGPHAGRAGGRAAGQGDGADLASAPPAHVRQHRGLLDMYA